MQLHVFFNIALKMTDWKPPLPIITPNTVMPNHVTNL